MSKEQDEVAINLLYEIYDAGYDAGIGRKSIDLTGYLEDIKQALNIADVVGSEERAELPSEMPDVGTKEFNDLCSKMFGGKSS